MGRNYQLDRAEARQAAGELWNGFTDNEKHGVRFGLFPYDKMTDPKYAHIESRLLAVALMDIAEKNGGMRA